MAASYRKIDYRVRPAKAVERKMFVEILRKLSEFGRLEGYRYVGFGSLYFSDFKLFHRVLGFDSMISIENTTDPIIQQRFSFNCPYRHVQMRYGLSTDILAALDWYERTVAWLDYDGHLDKTTFADLEITCSKAKSGNAIFVTVNAAAPAENNEDGEALGVLDALKKRVGNDRVPIGTKSSDFSGWGTAKVYRDIINTQIEDTLKKLNGVRPAGTKLVYKQLVNFHYEDGARMLTVGGVLYEADQSNLYERCGFDKLPFVAQATDAYLIDPPHLTFKEVRHIDASMPIPPADFNKFSIPRTDVERYVKVYRYFPNFIEADAG